MFDLKWRLSRALILMWVLSLAVVSCKRNVDYEERRRVLGAPNAAKTSKNVDTVVTFLPLTYDSEGQINSFIFQFHHRVFQVLYVSARNGEQGRNLEYINSERKVLLVDHNAGKIIDTLAGVDVGSWTPNDDGTWKLEIDVNKIAYTYGKTFPTLKGEFAGSQKYRRALYFVEGFPGTQLTYEKLIMKDEVEALVTKWTFTKESTLTVIQGSEVISQLNKDQIQLIRGWNEMNFLVVNPFPETVDNESLLFLRQTAHSFSALNRNLVGIDTFGDFLNLSTNKVAQFSLQLDKLEAISEAKEDVE